MEEKKKRIKEGIVPISFVVDSDLPDFKKYRGPNGQSFDMDCPFCGGKHKLNINVNKNVFRCNRCQKSGNALTLHNLLIGGERSAALKDLKKRFAGIAVESQVRYTELPEDNTVPPAPLGIRDFAYREMLKHLVLSDAHRENLHKRGLSDEDIERLGYKTVPVVGLSLIAKKTIGGIPIDRGGIPGFYDITTENPKLVKRKNGYLVPVKTINGKISGFQIRFDPLPDNATAEERERFHKYAWFTSGEKETGCSVTGCENIHFAGDWTTKDEAVYLTEGALKADVASVLSGKKFIGITGVNNTSQLPKVLKTLKKNGVKYVCVCVDMDYREKQEVANALAKIKEMIIEAGLKCPTLHWDEKYKGIDDFLLSQKKERKVND